MIRPALLRRRNRRDVRVAEPESPAGSLTPEARRQLDGALAEGIARHNAATAAEGGRSITDDIAEIPEREFPYLDIPAAQVAAYRNAAAPEFPAVRPVFYPAPSVAPVTAPMAALPANAAPPPPPPAPAAAAPQKRLVSASNADMPDLAVLCQVHDGLVRKWQSERAQAFIADKKELPFFAALTKELGWQGLHVPSKVTGWQRWSTGPWAAHEQALANADLARARAELEAVHARYAAEAAVERGAR